MNKNSNNTVNVSAKDRFARVLATENIHVSHSGSAQTASFNTQSRVLTLPRWENMNGTLYDMLVAHEVGHALYTPADVDSVTDLAAKHNVNIMVAKDYINVVEDARIERLMKQKFPGLRRDFILAYNDLIERGFFGDDALRDDKVDAMQLIDRINLHYKAGTVGACINFSTDEQPFINQIDMAETWEDIIDCADALLEYVDTVSQQEQSNEPDGDHGLPSEEGDDDSDENGAMSQSSDDGDNDSESGEPGDKSEEQDDQPQSSGSDMTNEEHDKGSNIKRSETQQKFEESLDSLRSRWDSSEDQFVSVPTIAMSDVMVDWTDLYDGENGIDTYYADEVTVLDTLDEVDRFLDESRKTCRSMAQEFLRKQKAVAFRRATIAKTGVLDMQKMVNYKWSEDIFRKSTILPNGKNHGLVILVDWSQSMECVMKDTIRQAIQMAMFCRMINIPFEVYSFSNVHAERRHYDPNRKLAVFTDSTTGEEISYSDLVMRNYLSSRMPKQKFFDACKRIAIMAETYNWNSRGTTRYDDRLGATPLDDAIYAVANWLPKYRTENGIEIMNTLIISDGASTSHPVRGQIVRDGHHYFRSDSMNKRHTDYTVQALDVLRHRTDTRLIQFFLTEKKSLARCWYAGLDQDTASAERQVAEYKKNKWTTTSDKQGFDERFIMFGKNAVQNADAFDSIGRADEDGVTITKIRNSFVKSMKQTGTSRAMLNRFIDIIA